MNRLEYPCTDCKKELTLEAKYYDPKTGELLCVDCNWIRGNDDNDDE